MNIRISQSLMMMIIKKALIRMMEIQCRKQINICLNFRKPLWASSSEAEMERKRQIFIGESETIGDWKERGKDRLGKKNSRAGPPHYITR